MRVIVAFSFHVRIATKRYSNNMKTYGIRSIVIAVCIIVSGCDSTRFFYNHADWLLNYRADRYFDFNSNQAPAARQEIVNWLAWHRRTQLVCYAELINQLENRTRVSIAATDVLWLEDQLLTHYEALVISAMGPATKILTNLDAKQINHLERRLAKDQKKLAKELKPDPQARLQARAKKTVAGVKKWFGRLSRNQVNWLLVNSRGLPDLYKPWLEYRAYRDRSLIELLRAGADAQTIGQTLGPLWLEPQTSMASEAIKQMQVLKVESHKLAVSFYNLATAKQKAHFWDRLRNYRDDFLVLANAENNATCEWSITAQVNRRDKDNYIAGITTELSGL